ncbi:MAG: SDR family oxidoreductase [Flavobacteriales bacterium]|nr:SDR family oxidoreductase [Flavobacteriales bacterium]
MDTKYIAVTGAGRGIGKATVLRLAGDGHTVFALTRNPDAWKSDTIGRIIPVYLNMEDESSFDKAISLMAAEIDGGLDVLVNNAGYLIHKPANEMKLIEVDKVFRVNVGGMLVFTGRCHRLLTRAVQAHIVNISSMGGVQGSMKFPGLSAYSASKGAVSILTECLAEEWKTDGIRVNGLALGSVRTEMLEQAFPGIEASFTVEEMAEYIAGFALNGGKYHHGKVLEVSVSTP